MSQWDPRLLGEATGVHRAGRTSQGLIQDQTNNIKTGPRFSWGEVGQRKAPVFNKSSSSVSSELFLRLLAKALKVGDDATLRHLVDNLVDSHTGSVASPKPPLGRDVRGDGVEEETKVGPVLEDSLFHLIKSQERPRSKPST